jgi:hypothetical protein
MSAQLRQSTLSFHQSGRIDANCPRRKPKAPTTLASAASNTLIFGQKRQRAVGGINERQVIIIIIIILLHKLANERQVIEAFKSSREHQAVGEPDSDNSDLYDSDGDHRPRPKLRRNTYS